MKSEKLIEHIAPDREMAEPSYLQVAQKLTHLIESGAISAGQSLPSERVLAEKLQLSRTTVRRAYDELRARDYLSTHGRAGVAVKAPPSLSPRLGRLKGFTEEMRELSMKPSTRLIERNIVTDRTMSSLFERPTTAKFLHLVRIRLGDETPLSREVAWYDLAAAPALAEWDVAGSAYQYLHERCGIALTRGEQTIEAVMSSRVEMEVFEFDKPGPCLLMKRKTYSVAGQMIEYVEGTFRGDAYAYRVTLNLE
ncbi:MAG: GntR family transcriptional regulator [Gammaproteobacteria bacterium]|nr:GntR family transcriptional regulator [Gammaproteobacteria bacterium]